MRTATPPKEDGLAHREKPDSTKASPALRTGTPRTGTPRTGTPRTGTPRAGTPQAGTPKIGTPKVDTPRTGTPRGTPKVRTPQAAPPAEKKAVTEDPVEDVPTERDEPEQNGNEQNGGEQNGDEAQPNGGATGRVDPGYKEDVEIDSFIDHRIDEANSTVDIKVRWEGGETTWETEWSLQEQVPALVFQYWEKLGGRDAATNLEVYHVFKILRRDTSSRAKKYEVQWVGYKRSDSTVEKEDFLRTIAPGELEKFQAKELASNASNDKRKGARGPGRPRKKPRFED